MIDTNKKIGILGGTFDPVHNAHLQIAEEVAREFHLDIIEFIPNKKPPHRPHPTVNAEHRLAMLRIATARYPNFLVNDIELSRPGPSYIVDTLKKLRSIAPEQPLCLIIGNDSFASLNEWHEWHDILKYAHLIVVNRPKARLPTEAWAQELLEKHRTQRRNDLIKTPSGKIYLHHINPIPISATNIRNELLTGGDVSNDIPAEVLSYIKLHQLYR